MKFNVDRAVPYSKIFGSVLLCSLALVGCNKNKDAENADSETATEQNVIACNDATALTALSSVVKESVNNQSQRLLALYAENAGAEVDPSLAKNIANSILVDIANPTELQPANENGMVTCRANLSLTIPNNDVSRASQVYKSLEQDLAEQLGGLNIKLNNNMLVGNGFSYVVGMEGGQTTARLVGQPEIINATADIVAKSQLNKALGIGDSTIQQGSNTASEAVSAPVQRPEPKPQRQVEQPKPEPKPEPKPKPAAQPAQAPQSTIETVEPMQDPANYTVPQDEQIEMVIIEEEGTY